MTRPDAFLDRWMPRLLIMLVILVGLGIVVTSIVAVGVVLHVVHNL